ncbi:MAG: hypothetical protein WCH43_04595 [Verrucomicrobiota bacterium]
MCFVCKTTAFSKFYTTMRCIFLIGVLAITGFLHAQGPDEPNEGLKVTADGSPETFLFSWWGHAGKTYFIQHCDDLAAGGWAYVPVIESGIEKAIHLKISSTAGKVFLRLKYTDIRTGDPINEDFDGDRVSNWNELQQGTDPFNATLDSNGLPLDWEEFYNIPAGTSGASLAPRGDGLSYLEAYQQGLNPVDLYDGHAPQLTIVDGSNQGDFPNLFLARPFKVKITDWRGNGLKNAALTYQLNSGDGMLATATDGSSPLINSLVVQSDSSGIGQAYFKLGSTVGGISVITATVGSGNQTSQVSFSASVGDINQAPAAPPIPVVTLQNGDTEAVTQWVDNSNNETAFLVQRTEDGSNWELRATLPANTQSYTDYGLNPAKAYFYRIVAHN